MARPGLNRPRDAAGRPLPVGAGPDEGAVPPVLPGDGDRHRHDPSGVLRAAQAYLDAGRAFAAHEVLEEAWKTAPATERELWHGLAQLAVALTHRQRGNAHGEAVLLERAATRLARCGCPGALAQVKAARAGRPVHLTEVRATG